MSDDLAEILGRRENAWLEFKDYANPRNRLSDLAEIVCAMANDLPQHGGGDIVIGVKDDGTPGQAVDTSDQTLLAITDLRNNGNILDIPSIQVEAATFDGHDVIRVHVERSTTPPVRYRGVAYVRPGPATVRASREDERVLTERRRAADLPFDARALPGTTLEDLDLERFRSTYLPAMVDREVIAENGRPVEQQLSSLHLARRGHDLEITVLGLLVLGLDPTSRIPGAYLQFVRYQGSGVDAPVVDEQELRGNVMDIGARLEPLLRGHLHTGLVEEGFRSVPAPDYPLSALRELSMNALMHKNYETSNAPVRIAWFSDRIEITNPGGPFGHVRADNFDSVNDYRNPSLAGAMKALGYVERFGRGIGLVRAALRKNGNPPPEFDIDQSSWSVTLRRDA